MPERVFLGWNKPFIGPLTDWLLMHREQLPGLLVVVPTAQAGRHLREALASVAGGLLAPKVVTPDHFFRPVQEGVASALEARYAWIEVLRSLSLRDVPHLFPVEPVERSFSWAAGVAAELEKVRNLLAEGGKFLSDAFERSPERERWRDLVEVERRVRARFDQWGLEDPLLAKVRAAEGYEPPPGTSGLVIAGVPDPVPIAVEVWKRSQLAVHVLIQAPESEAHAFDEWGRPGEEWIRRQVPIPRERVHVVAGPSELARKAVECCSGRNSDEVVIGLCDPAFGPAVEAAFAEAGWPAWNPEGRLAGSSMLRMLENFASLVRHRGRWDAAAAILRNPLLAEILGRKGMFEALRELDDIEANHLPDRLDRVSEICTWRASRPDDTAKGARRLSEMLDWCTRWCDRFSSGHAADALAEWVEEMISRGIDDGTEGRLIGSLEEACVALRRLEERRLLRVPGEALELVLLSLDPLRIGSGREEVVIDLSGWLELSHSPGTRMVLAGLHEGCVPDGNLDDAFLPDAMRESLGLRGAHTRHARDAFLFHSFAASRELDVIVAKVDATGEPRRPSRLLLAAEGAELAYRVKALSARPEGASRRLAPWSRGNWKLRFDVPLERYLNGTRKLSPSAIRDYLHCPFRFYLKRVLRWEHHDAGKMEMDPRDFGNLCHFALEQMGLDERMKTTTDALLLRDFLWERMDHGLSRFGPDLSLPLLVQREAARARMERFAELEVAQRLEGWKIEHVELKVGQDPHWEIGGQAISMQIDRIDFHPDHGWRVLDYKTSARAEQPANAHLRRHSERRRTFGQVMPGSFGATNVWKNVQMPLYAAFAKEWLGLGEPPAIGYVNLPATLNDVGFSMWKDFSEEKLVCALEWSEGVIAALRQGVHWPPVDLTAGEAAYDDFAALAPDGLAEAVSGTLIEEMKEIARDWDEKGRDA